MTDKVIVDGSDNGRGKQNQSDASTPPTSARQTIVPLTLATMLPLGANVRNSGRWCWERFGGMLAVADSLGGCRVQLAEEGVRSIFVSHVLMILRAFEAGLERR